MPLAFDAAWKRRALAGDPRAVARLADECLGPLYRFCLYRVGGNAHLCEEVVQETLVRALRDLAHYDPGRSAGDLFPWLAGLARNEISRLLNRERRYQPLDALWLRLDREMNGVEPAAGGPLVGGLDPDEVGPRVNATMAQLSARYRDLLEAKYLHGRSVRDLATARSCSEKAVESCLSRAREAFRKTFRALAQAGDGVPAPRTLRPARTES